MIYTKIKKEGGRKGSPFAHERDEVGDMHCISISYRKAPVRIREIFAFSEEEKLAFEHEICARYLVSGCLVISTCNRSEIYYSGDKSLLPVIEKEAALIKHADYSEMKRYFLTFCGEGALRHLFKVTVGLDSMVLGEDEIMRQMKEAYQLSLAHNHTSNEMNIAFQNAFYQAKRIKTSTRISTTPVSVATLAVNKILDHAKEISRPVVLVVGATGKMGSILVRNLCGRGGLKVYGTVRSSVRDIAGYVTTDLIHMIHYRDRYQYMKTADVIVSVTASPHYTFTSEEVAKVLDGQSCRKLFIDLAVPSDIDKDISAMEGLEVIDIDYFEKASLENNELKQQELGKAEMILDECVDETLKEIYFQKFYGRMDQLAERVKDQGIQTVLYRLKEGLGSQQLKAVLELLEEMI